MDPFPIRRTVRSIARGQGDLLSYAHFKAGRFELASDAERLTLMTTMLTDVASTLWARCQALDRSVSRHVIKPNGFFSASFVIAYEAQQFRIEIHRDISKPWMLLLPGYAELPSSYQVTVHIQAATTEVERALVDSLGEQADATGSGATHGG